MIPDLESLTPEQKDKLRAVVKRYQENPVAFGREVIGSTYWSKQEEILNSVRVNQRTTVGSGHDVGKTYVAADVALWFLSTFTPSIVITTAPTWRQVEKVLWGEIAAHHAKAKVPLGGKVLETEIKVGPKWYAIGFSSDSPDAFHGFHERHILVIVDEPSGIDDPTFEAIESVLANEGAKLLLIGNPVSSTGYFARSLTIDSTFEGGRVFISCLESPNVVEGKTVIPGLVTKKWCDERKEIWGEDSPVYIARVLGRVPSETEDTLIRLDWTNRSTLRHSQFTNTKITGECNCSVDVARFGSNNTVIIIKIGRRVVEIKSYRGYDLMHTVGVIVELDKKYHFDNIIIDDNGVGGGVTDRMRELKFQQVVAVVAQGKPQDEGKYFNRRSEMAWRVREALRTNELDLPEHDKLEFECNNQFYEMSSDDCIKVMSKTLLKRKGMESPDFFDALCLQFANDLPDSMRVAHAVYSEELFEKMHVISIDPEAMKIGTTRYNWLFPSLNGQSFSLWGLADRAGRVFVYRELLIDRTSSTVLERLVKGAEDVWEEVEERIIPKIYVNGVDAKERYTLLDQLADVDLDFIELELDEQLASFNLREGLRFEDGGLPHLFFHKDCLMTLRAMKFFMNPKLFQNEPVFEIINKTLGLMVLSEPIWIKGLYV